MQQSGFPYFASLDGISQADFDPIVKTYLDEYSPNLDYHYLIESIRLFGKKPICLNIFSLQIADYLLEEKVDWRPADSGLLQHV